MPPVTPACSTCQFFGPTGDVQGVERGPCRINPPLPQEVATPKGRIFIAAWPLAKPDDWCNAWVKI